MADHIYKTTLHWSAEGGEGTKSYRSFSRTHTITAKTKQGEDKPAIVATSAFHSLDHYNPDELLIGSLSSCHMLWYLHLCADAGVVVMEYRDEAECVLSLDEKMQGKVTGAVLRPRVTIAAGDTEVARALHEDAHAKCFVANSVNFPVRCEPEIVAG
ncbi:MAG: OsmC family protein [Xanthobacteraceae bacterium]|nr:OsmC family protein [Xanthobacteraceae bacterium]QYK46052.1 MAG: OsmC family protein [Xanthobacteraceae bacterium]